MVISCHKESEDPIEDSDNEITIGVATSGEAIHAGEEQVFTFSGDINKVEFYSGEPGHVYGHMGKSQKPLEGEFNISFVARVMNGYEFEPHELHAFISNDFTGEYTYEAIQDAHWKPLNDRITFPATNKDGPDGDGKIENKINIADLMEPGKLLYVCFRYTCSPRPPAPRNGRQWRVGSYSLTHELSGEVTTISDYEDAEWTFVTHGEVESGRAAGIVSADGKALNFLGNQQSTYDGFQTWAISPAHDLYAIVPDEGVTIESPTDLYKHMYAVPGLYEATFVLHSSDSEEPLVKKVSVTVLP